MIAIFIGQSFRCDKCERLNEFFPNVTGLLKMSEPKFKLGLLIPYSVIFIKTARKIEK
jgi:hypothetical protein